MARPEGIVVTDGEGRVREANLAFMQMAQATDLEAIIGQPLERWVPGAGAALVSGMRAHGLAPIRRVTLLRAGALELAVDMAGALLADIAGGDIGITLRPCGSDVLTADARAAALLRAIDALAGELGNAPLPACCARPRPWHSSTLCARRWTATRVTRWQPPGCSASRLKNWTSCGGRQGSRRRRHRPPP